MNTITVAIVEDLDDIRNGLAALINGSEGYRCVGVFSNGEDALRDVPVLKPDVVLMDIDMPKMNGIECIKALKVQLPALQITMLTVFEDDEKIFRSLQAGASGYLLKKTPPVKLLEAIQELHHGGSPMSSQIARKVVQAFQQTGESKKQTENLSPREHEILSYLAKGYRYKEIADTLFISVETVRTHLRNIYEKLQVRSRTEAVLKYFNK
ncbi:MAG: response regulator transcription factor [Ignavibacteriales bacterium]|nr:response regulator transcription factor [Ignavibacteriales bacterium]